MMERICDRVYYLPHDEQGDRPALGYVRGDRFTLMVDAGNSPAHVAVFQARLAAEGLPTPDFVALTHWHWDHVFGAHALPCPLIACSQTNGYLAEMRKWAWTDEAMAARLETGEDTEFCDLTIREVYPDRTNIVIREADIIFEDTLTLDLGGITCLLRRIDNPHSADSVLVHIPQEGVVFLGDAAYQATTMAARHSTRRSCARCMPRCRPWRLR